MPSSLASPSSSKMLPSHESHEKLESLHFTLLWSVGEYQCPRPPPAHLKDKLRKRLLCGNKRCDQKDGATRRKQMYGRPHSLSSTLSNPDGISSGFPHSLWRTATAAPSLPSTPPHPSQPPPSTPPTESTKAGRTPQRLST